MYSVLLHTHNVPLHKSMYTLHKEYIYIHTFKSWSSSVPQGFHRTHTHTNTLLLHTITIMHYAYILSGMYTDKKVHFKIWGDFPATTTFIVQLHCVSGRNT